MAVTAKGTPYVESSDLVANYPGTSLALANHIDGLSLRSATASVSTSQSTGSQTYTDLATVGPSVTLTTGTKALIIITAGSFNADASPAKTSVAVSGATTVAATDDNCLSSFGVQPNRASVAFLQTGLTAGSNVFTLKYKSTGGSSAFSVRNISVIDMGS